MQSHWYCNHTGAFLVVCGALQNTGVSDYLDDNKLESTGEKTYQRYSVTRCRNAATS